MPGYASTSALIYGIPVPDPPRIDYRGEEPPYRQIAGWLRDRIKSGDLKPGQVLPSEKEIMDQAGIGRQTARKAVKVLRDEGLVHTIPQRGTYVAHG